MYDSTQQYCEVCAVSEDRLEYSIFPYFNLTMLPYHFMVNKVLCVYSVYNRAITNFSEYRGHYQLHVITGSLYKFNSFVLVNVDGLFTPELVQMKCVIHK